MPKALTTCNSELVFWLRSAAVRAASCASLDPSVAKRILVGKMLIEGVLLARGLPCWCMMPAARVRRELLRIPLPRTPVNKGKNKGAEPLGPPPSNPQLLSPLRASHYPLGKGASCSSKNVSKNFLVAGGRDLKKASSCL